MVERAAKGVRLWIWRAIVPYLTHLPNVKPRPTLRKNLWAQLRGACLTAKDREIYLESVFRCASHSPTDLPTTTYWQPHRVVIWTEHVLVSPIYVPQYSRAPFGCFSSRVSIGYCKHGTDHPVPAMCTATNAYSQDGRDTTDTFGENLAMTNFSQLEPMRMLDPATAEHVGWKPEGS